MIGKWRSIDVRNNTDRENYSTRKKFWLSVTYYTTYSTWAGLRLKLGHHCQRLTTDPMAYDTALYKLREVWKVYSTSVCRVSEKGNSTFLRHITKFASGHARRKYVSQLSTTETQVSQKKRELTLQPNISFGHLVKLWLQPSIKFDERVHSFYGENWVTTIRFKLSKRVRCVSWCRQIFEESYSGHMVNSQVFEVFSAFRNSNFS
jgi:hypothetical protein